MERDKVRVSEYIDTVVVHPDWTEEQHDAAIKAAEEEKAKLEDWPFM